MKSPIYSGAAFLLSATPVFATCEMPVISVKAGEFSNYQILNSEGLAELANKHGGRPVGDHVLVIDESDGAGYWVSRDRIGEAVMVTGGNPDGFSYSGPVECVPTDIPVISAIGKASIAESKPRLNDKVAVSSTQAETVVGAPSAREPNAGTWVLQIGEPVVGLCPEMMKASMGHSLAETLQSFFSTKPLRITEPFHPDQLDFTAATDTVWENTAPGAWYGETYSEIFANLPSSSAGASGLSWDLIVESETEIRHDARIQIVMPPEAKATLGGDTCVVTSKNKWTWVDG